MGKKKEVSKIIRRARRDPVTLWSTQHPEVWRELQEKGIYRADGRRIYDGSFRSAYQWMKAQMAKRLAHYKRGSPIWAFCRYPLKVMITPGDYIFKIKVGQERVLLSDFSAWHCVLNGFDCRVGRGDREKSLEETWENIFDLERLDRSHNWGSVRIVQAVFEELRLKDVLEVRRADGRFIYRRGH